MTVLRLVSISVGILALLLVCGRSDRAQAVGNIDPIESFAWSENTGWLNFAPTAGPGVTVTSDALTGLAWGEDIGWVNMNPSPGKGVLNDGTGQLSGYAWSENAGWINFSPTGGGGVTINACGEFHGTAWGENIGWITFFSTGSVPYGVVTEWESPVDTVAPVTTATLSPPGPDQGGGWRNQDVTVMLVATDCGVGVAALHYMIDDQPEVVSPDSSVDFTVVTEGMHAVSFFSVDGAGNTEPVDPSDFLMVLIDKTPPVVTLTAPAEGGGFLLNHPMPADYAGTDALSGVLSLTAPVPNGVPFDVTTPGSFTFPVTATDRAGNVTLVTHTYSVDFAGNINPSRSGGHYAWGENIGWVNFQPTFGPGVTVTDTAVTGFAWSENAGWMNLSPTPGGVANDGGGHLSGFAWAENIGWINFAPTHGGVTIDPNTGVFSGHAWGENVGWINFTVPAGATHGVTTAWRGQVSFVPNLDIDLNGEANVWDGSMICRYLDPAITDPSDITAGVVDPAGNRADPLAIMDYLTLAEQQGMLDADGSGSADAFDCKIITAFLFGIRSDSLLDGGLSDGATRTTADVIVAFLNSFLPGADPTGSGVATAGTSEAVTTTIDVDSSASALTDSAGTTGLSEPDMEVPPSQRGLKKGHRKREKKRSRGRP